MSLASYILLLTAHANLGTPTPQKHAVSLTVDCSDGATISGTKNFRVLVTTDDIVTKVEMYVGSEMRADSESTPYRFTLDTVNEKDGDLTLKWIAYTDAGGKASKQIHVKVDNGLSLGAAAHVDKGIGLLQNGMFDDAIEQGRIALKIDKKSAAARELLARAYLHQGTYDRAQKYVQDVLDEEPNNLEALSIRAAIGLDQAFGVMGQNVNSMDAVTTVGGAFKDAIDSQRKMADARLDAVGAPTDANRLEYVRLADEAGRFTDAIAALTTVYEHNPAKPDLADALAYSQMRAGRLDDALRTLDTLKRIGRVDSDAYAQALTALIEDRLNDTAASNKAMDDAELNDISSVGVQTAQASIALRRNKTAALAGITAALEKEQGQLTEVNYLLYVLYNRTGNYAAARKAFRTAVLAQPLNFDAYIEEGNQALSAVLGGKMKPDDIKYTKAYAEMMFKTAIEARPDSYQALTGLALAYLNDGNVPDAFKYAQAAAAAQPDYAAAQVTLAVAADAYARQLGASPTADNILRLSVAANDRAGKIDPDFAGGRGVQTPSRAFEYYERFGRSLIIAPPF